MRLDPAYRPITADEFLQIDFGTDRKFELVDGVIQMMTGGLASHAHVAGNIYFALRQKLNGSGCRPFNSDMGIRVGPTTVRYPDISVICRDDWLLQDDVKAFDDPLVVFEVLSPSTTAFDQGSKRYEYQQLPSTQAIVLVDPVNRLTRTHYRQSASEWCDTSFAQPHDVELPMIGVTLTEEEIFAGVPL